MKNKVTIKITGYASSKDIEPIPPTPITPEKMAAIDAIIDTINKHKENRSLDWAGIEIIGILSEHKLI